MTTAQPVRDWEPDQLPSLEGRSYLVTGGNSGIGLEAAKMLCAAGADIVIACRNPQKAKRAAKEIAAAGEGACDIIALDLSSLDSVRRAAGEIRAGWNAIDGLINNAGVMQTPETRTEDGFELQFATNHLGHFLLSGLLFDLVEQAEGRIVTVSSIAHTMGRIHFDDLMFERRYNGSFAYGQSKLANLLFALELDRRLRAAASPVASIACHPGYSATALQTTGPQGLLNATYRVLNTVFAQSAYRGAIPTVLAAAGEEAESGGYYGPTSFGGVRGPVGDAFVASRALDQAAAKRLWEESERLVGFEWNLG